MDTTQQAVLSVPRQNTHSDTFICLQQQDGHNGKHNQTMHHQVQHGDKRGRGEQPAHSVTFHTLKDCYMKLEYLVFWLMAREMGMTRHKCTKLLKGDYTQQALALFATENLYGIYHQ